MRKAGDDRPLFLVGFMGSGKTAVGKELAGLLGWDFVDTDALVEETSGRTISEIFRDSGEEAFREMEREALFGIGDRRRTVVAAGGGLFARRDARVFMKERGVTIWLDVPLEELRDRVGPGDGRPLWEEGSERKFRVFFEKRRAAYALADLAVRPRGEGPEGVAEAVLARFRGFLR